MPANLPCLPPRITVDNANEVVQQLEKWTASATQSEMLDISMVSHCDSAGIAALLEAKIQAKQNGAELVYTHPHSQLRDLATFLKVAHLLFP